MVKLAKACHETQQYNLNSDMALEFRFLASDLNMGKESEL